MVFFLPQKVDALPHPLQADPDGLLAIGTHLDADLLLTAYQFGIFPWSHAEDPVFWWYTHPRCILWPDNLKVQKSMRPLLNNERYQVSMDTSFRSVVNACRRIRRKGQDDTWITPQLVEAFEDLHNRGLAHSVEVKEGDKLIGGLYGLALGKIFFGESMFSYQSNVSKLALIHLVDFLKYYQFTLIDCQQVTDHLLSLGATTLEKEDFFKLLKRNTFETHLSGPWTKLYSNFISAK